jgi:hypothetical protein
MGAFLGLHPRGHGLIAIAQIVPTIFIFVPAVFALMGEIRGNLWFLRKEVTFGVSRNVSVNALRMTFFAA